MTEPGPPAVETTHPPVTTAYELPTARHVVAAGLQLALASAGDLRRASMYVGLLALAALGPAVVFAIVAIDYFDLDVGAAFEDLAMGGLLFLDRPELLGPLLFLELLFIVGIALLLAISIDAQAIGIAILAGRAGGGRIRLPEAITRARQVFWRMAGGTFLVGVYTTLIELILNLAFGIRTPGLNTGAEFLITTVSTLATVPFAFLATGIVLGNVGPIEALKRSDQLFRARPLVALVVVLFTLVTAAIQVFALSAGLDLVIRAGELMRLDVAGGGLGLVLGVALALAIVIAFGSLLFTIAALVSAPQVAAFLGLTFFAGGLDQARATTPDGRPPGFRWVSRPMQIVVGLLVALTLLGIPAMWSGPAS